MKYDKRGKDGKFINEQRYFDRPIYEVKMHLTSSITRQSLTLFGDDTYAQCLAIRSWMEDQLAHN